MNNKDFFSAALSEDIGTGDFSTMACIESNVLGKAVLKVKESGIIAGIRFAKELFEYLEPTCNFKQLINDGDRVNNCDFAFEVIATVHTILKAERLALNAMQRMSGIATLTNQFVEKVKGYNAKILDTRKTTPLFRKFEKEAVRIGGATNHRMGLYDMIMLKDNHIDFCGGIEKAINKTVEWLSNNNMNLKIEIETRNLKEVETIIKVGNVNRILLDNFLPDEIERAVQLIEGRYETEASGGINLHNIESYAKTGVDFISVGSIIHHAVSMDLSLKAQTI